MEEQTKEKSYYLDTEEQKKLLSDEEDFVMDDEFFEIYAKAFNQLEK